MSMELYKQLLKENEEHIVFQKMKNNYKMSELSLIFSYQFMFNVKNITAGWKWSSVFQREDCISYLVSLHNIAFVYLYILPELEKAGFDLFFKELDGNYDLFENEDLDFNFYYLPIHQIPLYFIKKHINKNWHFRSEDFHITKYIELSDHPQLTPEFVEEFIDTEYNYRRNLMRSIWNFNILLERNICKTEIINMHNIEGTRKVNVPLYFPVYSLEYFTKNPNISYFILGNEEPLDKNMKLCDIKSDSIFVL